MDSSSSVFVPDGKHPPRPNYHRQISITDSEAAAAAPTGTCDFRRCTPILPFAISYPRTHRATSTTFYVYAGNSCADIFKKLCLPFPCPFCLDVETKKKERKNTKHQERNGCCSTLSLYSFVFLLFFFRLFCLLLSICLYSSSERFKRKIKIRIKLVAHIVDLSL